MTTPKRDVRRRKMETVVAPAASTPTPAPAPAALPTNLLQEALDEVRAARAAAEAARSEAAAAKASLTASPGWGTKLTYAGVGVAVGAAAGATITYFIMRTPAAPAGV
jgi:hypothetical protein